MRTPPALLNAPADAVASLGAHRFLLWQLARREVVGRYRGSALGLAWSFLQPLLMLAIYTLVFGSVMQVRWPETPGTAELGFAVILFSGLIVHGLLAEVITSAPRLVAGQPNYVKRVVFPLEVLSAVSLAASLFHALVSFAVLLVFHLWLTGTVHVTVLLLPVVWAPYLLLLLGLSWALTALGVYLRDIGQITGLAATALLFVSPIFFPLEALPASLHGLVYLNPVTVIVEATRAIVLWGRAPDWAALAVYAVVAGAVAWIGYWGFQKSRRGFADVV